jgi:sec-independent protein translocase protein TatA
MPNVGIGEWMIILVILLLLFGPSKLAGLGAAAGKTIREFRNAMSEATHEVREAHEVKEAPDTKPEKPST